MCFVFINTYIWSFIALSLSVSSLNWNSDPNTEKCAFSLPTAALKWQFCHCGWSIYKWGQLNSIISCLFWQSLGKNDTDSFLVEGTWIWMPGLFLQQQSPLVMSNEGCLPSANEGNESWWSCLLWQKGKGKRKKGNLPGALAPTAALLYLCTSRRQPRWCRNQLLVLFIIQVNSHGRLQFWRLLHALNCKYKWEVKIASGQASLMELCWKKHLNFTIP